MVHNTLPVPSNVGNFVFLLKRFGFAVNADGCTGFTLGLAWDIATVSFLLNEQGKQYLPHLLFIQLEILHVYHRKKERRQLDYLNIDGILTGTVISTKLLLYPVPSLEKMKKY